MEEGRLRRTLKRPVLETNTSVQFLKDFAPSFCKVAEEMCKSKLAAKDTEALGWTGPSISKPCRAMPGEPLDGAAP